MTPGERRSKFNVVKCHAEISFHSTREFSLQLRVNSIEVRMVLISGGLDSDLFSIPEEHMGLVTGPLLSSHTNTKRFVFGAGNREAMKENSCSP